MNEFKGYRNGVDLGGWLSQCGYEKEHIESFITEADIARIASWGCDHVRLPFDYNIILDDSGNVLESGLKLLGRGLVRGARAEHNSRPAQDDGIFVRQGRAGIRVL